MIQIRTSYEMDVRKLRLKMSGCFARLVNHRLYAMILICHRKNVAVKCYGQKQLRFKPSLYVIIIYIFTVWIKIRV